MPATIRARSASRTKRRGGRKGGRRPAGQSGRRTSRRGSARSGKRNRPPWLITVGRALAITAALAVLGVFCFWVAKTTFTPIDDNGQAVGNTDVGHSLRFYLDRPSIKEAVRQIGGNLVLLAPLGVLLPVLFGRLHGLVPMAAATVAISMAVEIIQGTLIPGRAFDIDDVVLNVAGALLVYLLAGRKVARLVRGRDTK